MKFIIHFEELKFTWTLNVAFCSSSHCGDKCVLPSKPLACNKDMPSAGLFQNSHQVRCALLSLFVIIAKCNEHLTILFSKLLTLFEMFLGNIVCFCQDRNHSDFVLFALCSELFINTGFRIFRIKEFQYDLGIGKDIVKVGDIFLDKIIL